MSILQDEWIGKTVEVAKSTNKSLEGIRGKIVNETKHLIEIQTPKGLKRVPKKGTLIAFGKEIVDLAKAEVSPEERIKLKNGNRKNMQ